MLLTTIDEQLVLRAPARLSAESRVEFRCAALACLERVNASGAPTLDIDCAETRDVDASGLAILVLVQKRAREQGRSTRLLRAPERVRNLLALTKLDFLFEFVD
jgi:anti-anti-sigma regulatory factor